MLIKRVLQVLSVTSSVFASPPPPAERFFAVPRRTNLSKICLSNADVGLGARRRTRTQDKDKRQRLDIDKKWKDADIVAETDYISSKHIGAIEKAISEGAVGTVFYMYVASQCVWHSAAAVV